MITRIRIEAEADTKERVIQELDEASQKTLLVLGGSPWECMDDVVVPNNRLANGEFHGYKGRRVHHYRGKHA